MAIMRQLRAARAILGPARPIILYHKPTARCDCRCRFCNSWVGQPDHDDVLPSDRILRAIDRARAGRMTTYTVWGGEPLVAEHLPEWLCHARKLGLQTVVCTSGYRLAERAREIGPHIERLLLSLEAVGQNQDRIRNTPGLFDRVVAGLEEYRKHGHDVVLWSNLSRENADQVDQIVRFARDQRIGVEFFPASVYPGYNERLILEPREQEEVFGRVMAQKRKGAPVFNTWYALKIMASGRRFKCNLARLAVQLNFDGRVYACDPGFIPELKPYGSIDEVDLGTLGSGSAYHQARKDLSSCNRCLLPCVANMADWLPAQSLRRALNQAYYRFQ